MSAEKNSALWADVKAEANTAGIDLSGMDGLAALIFEHGRLVKEGKKSEAVALLADYEKKLDKQRPRS